MSAPHIPFPARSGGDLPLLAEPFLLQPTRDLPSAPGNTKAVRADLFLRPAFYGGTERQYASSCPRRLLQQRRTPSCESGSDREASAEGNAAERVVRG
eukprot:1802333-Rhodomonas_salina.1